MSFKDTDEVLLMHWKSDNIEIMTNDKVNEVNEEVFQSFLFRYQFTTEITMKGSSFIFDYVYCIIVIK